VSLAGLVEHVPYAEKDRSRECVGLPHNASMNEGSREVAVTRDPSRRLNKQDEGF